MLHVVNLNTQLLCTSNSCVPYDAIEMCLD